MIEVFEGRIGGGKTLSAVERCLLTWINSGVVFTNIEIRWEECKALALAKYGVELDDRQFTRLSDEQISEFWMHTQGGTRERPTLVIVDEADVWLGNQTTGVKVNVEMFTFLKQSRKMNTDIIFITQALKNLHTQIARLAQYVWRFRDMEKFRLKALGISWPFPQILQVCYDYDGKTQMSRRYWTKDKRLYKCYDTNALYSVFTRLDALDLKAIQAKRVKKAGVRFEAPLWSIAAALVVLVVLLLV